MSSSPNRPPLTPPSVELTDEKKGDLARLWASHTRDASIVSCANMDDTTYRFVVRLHSFFLPLFRRQQQGSSSSSSSSSSDAREQQPTPSSSDSEDRIENSNMDVRWVTPLLSLPAGRQVVVLDHQAFLNDLDTHECRGQAPTRDYIRQHSFGAFLHHRPEPALVAAGCAIGLAAVATRKSTSGHRPAAANRFLDSSQVVVRFTNVQPQVRMMDVKTGMAYKFVSIKGHVVKARPKRLRVVTADFECAKCGETVVSHVFQNGKYAAPSKCDGFAKCRSKNFFLLRPTAKYMDFQEVRLQEAQEENSSQGGRTPRQVNVELTHDLVDACHAGDVVTVAGMVLAVNSAVAAGKSGKAIQETSTYQLFVKANSVSVANSHTAFDNSREEKSSNSSTTAAASHVVFTPEQLESIVKLTHADHRYFGMTERRAFPFDLLVRSLCPSIIGHDMVKAGILLALLGGTPPQMTATNSIRSNCHILVVGDPGMAKSQMLLAASQVAARSVYVGGNTASTTGLTVSLTKEPGGEVGIEAGALVLADQGICCIDEFDKMAKTHQDGLLEAMEQQQISIAKAGVVASLPARCSVIAAANPKHGSYNMSKTVAENLNMATPILSRFDLVFILRDRADKEQDRLVSSNIMNLYRKNAKGNVKSEAGPLMHHGGDPSERMPMKDRLTWVADFQKQPLPADLVRDYISYAREYCKPKLTQEAAIVLKRYFMDLRYPRDGSSRNDTVPITTRQLEALIRLSQARAKACLREFVLEEDARDVVELMTQSVEQVHRDERGVVDRTRGGAGGKSNRKLKKTFVAELQKFGGGELSMDDLRRVADRVDCGLGEFQSMIEDLRNESILMKRSNGLYKLV